jgi:hypothetical protein
VEEINAAVRASNMEIAANKAAWEEELAKAQESLAAGQEYLLIREQAATVLEHSLGELQKSQVVRSKQLGEQEVNLNARQLILDSQVAELAATKAKVAALLGA